MVGGVSSDPLCKLPGVQLTLESSFLSANWGAQKESPVSAGFGLGGILLFPLRAPPECWFCWRLGGGSSTLRVSKMLWVLVSFFDDL